MRNPVHRHLARHVARTAALLFAGVLFAMPGLARPPDKQDVLQLGEAESVDTLRIDGEVMFDTTGKVIEHQIKTPNLPEGIRSMADAKLASLRFQPVTLDGRPVNVRTFARMTFVARKQPPAQGEGYEVAMENIRFYDGELGKDGAPKSESQQQIENSQRSAQNQSRRPIAYPAGLRMAGVNGAVLLVLKLAPNGAVEEIAPYQSALFQVRGNETLMERARKLFEDNAVKAVSQWRFQPPKRPADATDEDWRLGLLAVFFTMQGGPAPEAAGQWRRESRSRQQVPAWLLQDQRDGSRIGISDVDGSEGWVPVKQGVIRLDNAQPATAAKG